MRAVNLLPDAPRRAQRRPVADRPARALVPVAAAAGLLLIAGLTYWGISERSQAADRADRVAQAGQTRDRLRLELADFRTLAEDDGRRLARRGAVVSLATGRTDWERLIRDVATVLPAGVWLTEVDGTSAPAEPTPATAGAAAPAPTTGGATLRLDGVARNQVGVATTMARVGSVAGLGEPRLISSARDDIGRRSLVRFSIEMTVDRRAQSRTVVMPVAQETTP